jgi:hypothetical protein
MANGVMAYQWRGVISCRNKSIINNNGNNGINNEIISIANNGNVNNGVSISIIMANGINGVM